VEGAVRGDAIELDFLLSYSPELNPDELVNVSRGGAAAGAS